MYSKWTELRNEFNLPNQIEFAYNQKYMLLQILGKRYLYKAQKTCNNKHTIALTQITNTETFTFIAVLVFKLLNRKVLFIKRKDNRNC